MANSTKALNEKVKIELLAKLIGFLADDGNEILTVGSNEIAMPLVNEKGDEIFATIKVSIPTGSRDGDAYDGYALADEYKAKLAEKAEKAEKAKIAKEKKIAKDKANREKLAKSKAEHESK